VGEIVVEFANLWSKSLARYAEFSSIDLVGACAASEDQRAWAEFTRRFHTVISSAVRRTAARWGCSAPKSQVDDLAQETYLKLCESDRQLLRMFHPRHQDSIYGFLKVVAANVVHDYFKSVQAAKRGAGQMETLIDDLQIDPKTIGTDSFEAISRRLQLEHVDKILRQVTAGKDQERKRMIFWLRHQQGLTAAEIASIPSIRLTTEGVESVLMRLTAMIRAHLLSSVPHREVKVLKRKIRSKKKRA
jgi:RNA polymerase sigma-70 factor, ECF subfamily